METAGPIDPAVLSTKTNEELRHLLAVLKQKETDEQLNVNYSPYSSQRVIAEGRLATVRAKIRQVETEFDRRRSVAIPLPLPTLTSRAIQQFAESRCTFGIADAHLFEPYVQGRMFESPDPFSHCHRSHKKLCLQPREYFQDSVCIRRNVKIRDTSDTGTAMYKDAGTGESRKEKGVESKSSVEICTCETTSSEESVDEDKKKLRLDIDQREDGINSKSALKVSPHIVTRAEVCGELEKEERKEETDERAKDDEMEKIREEKSIDARIDSRERIKIKNEVKMLKRIEKKSEIIGPIQMRVKSRESVRMYKGSKTDVSKKKVFDCKYISTKELEESEEHDKKESIEKDGTDVSIKDKAVEKTTKANEIEVSKKQVVDCKYISIKQPEESEEYDKKKMFHVIRERRKENQKTKKITSEPKLELENIEKDDADVSIKDKTVEKMTKPNEIEVSKKQMVDCKYICIKQPEETEEHDKKKMFHVIRERRKENQKSKNVMTEPKLELETIEKNDEDISIKNEPVEKTSEANKTDALKKMMLDYKCISIKKPEESEEHDKKKIFHIIKERRKENQKPKNVTSEPKLELESVEKDDADVSIKDEPIKKTKDEADVLKKKVVDYKYVMEAEENDEDDNKKIFHVIKERKRESKRKKEIKSDRIKLENLEKDDADVSIKDEKSKFAYFPFKKLEKLKKTISHSTCTPDKENAKDDKVEKDDEVAKDEEVEKDERNKFEKKKNVQFVSTMTHVKYDKNFGDFYGWDIKEYSVQTTENQWQETVECDSSKDVGEEDETENDGVYFLSKKENCSIVFDNQKSIPVSTSIEMSNMIEKCTIAEKMFPKNCRINGK